MEITMQDLLNSLAKDMNKKVSEEAAMSYDWKTISAHLKEVPFSEIGLTLEESVYEFFDAISEKLDKLDLESIPLENTKSLVTFLYFAEVATFSAEKRIRDESKAQIYVHNHIYYNTILNSRPEILKLRNKYFPNLSAEEITKMNTSEGSITNNELKTKSDAIIYEQKSNQNKATSNEDCFVATAIYNDYNHPKVMVLRNFRDNKLKGNFFGRLFIKIYYKVGPSMAKASKHFRVVKSVFTHIIEKIVEKIEKES